MNCLNVRKWLSSICQVYDIYEISASKIRDKKHSKHQILSVVLWCFARFTAQLRKRPYYENSLVSFYDNGFMREICPRARCAFFPIQRKSVIASYFVFAGRSARQYTHTLSFISWVFDYFIFWLYICFTYIYITDQFYYQSPICDFTYQELSFFILIWNLLKRNLYIYIYIYIYMQNNK